MLNVRTLSAAVLLCLAPFIVSAEDFVVQDGGVGLTYEELEFLVRQWTPQMREAAAKDPGDRLELLSMTLANKRVAAEAATLVKDAPRDDYWGYQMRVQGEQRNFVLGQVAKNLEIPDFEALARERYETEKDKYALVKETRTSSHILFKDEGMGRQYRVVTEQRAQKVLDQLLAGADFEEMVKQHSEDPGTRAKGGKFDRWMIFGDLDVTPRYSGALFEIDEIGGYSSIVGTEFGVHIIRLDGIREKSYKPYEQVKATIMTDLETEYRKLAMKDYLSQFQITEEALINGDAMDKLFAPYKPAEVLAPETGAAESATGSAEQAR